MQSALTFEMAPTKATVAGRNVTQVSLGCLYPAVIV